MTLEVRYIDAEGNTEHVGKMEVPIEVIEKAEDLIHSSILQTSTIIILN